MQCTRENAGNKLMELVQNPTNPLTSSHNILSEKDHQQKQELKPLLGDHNSNLSGLFQLHPVPLRKAESQSNFSEMSRHVISQHSAAKY
jgi:hypothetical protein